MRGQGSGGRIGTAFGAGIGLMGPAAPSQLRPLRKLLVLSLTATNQGAPVQEAQHDAGNTGAQFDITSECPTAPEVAAAIMRMDSKAAGADGIPTALLKPSAAPTVGGGEGAG